MSGNGSEVFAGDEILTTEILDRLLYHVHIYQLRELDKLLTPRPAAPPPPTREVMPPRSRTNPVRKTG